MSAEVSPKQAQWQKLFGYILGNQAAWIADIGLKAGLFRAVADAGEEGITEEALARRLDYKLRYVQVGAEGPLPSSISTGTNRRAIGSRRIWNRCCSTPPTTSSWGAHPVLHRPLRGLSGFSRVPAYGRDMASQRP
jgi:hypothetical protein